MATTELVTSKVTERNQTTLPPSVRKALELEHGERIGYVIEDGYVKMVNASRMEHEDTVLDG
ncbi:MAG: type II toxin-antitoxin system PrlF family antitoxin, partial [Longimicrobiales bacterium]